MPLKTCSGRVVHKIFFSNVGYAKGIDGTLAQHVQRFHRHLYFGVPPQQQVLAQLKSIIKHEDPDLCCFVEVDRGSFHSSYFNQLNYLVDDDYCHYDIADKYGENNPLGRLPLFQGKSNAFISKQQLDFQKLYFKRGSKRLIYRIGLPNNITLYFGHFSLQEKVRALQLAELRNFIQTHDGEVIIMADFNIMQGFKELRPLLDRTDLMVLNDEAEHTFRLHRRSWALDLCICSQSLAERVTLRVIPQPYSDHAALLIEGDFIRPM